MLGMGADDGHIISPRDYRVDQQVTTLGTLSGHRIVQILSTIHARPALVISGASLSGNPPTQWKILLVQDGPGDHYVEIYRLQAGSGLFMPLRSAAIYGTGLNTILGTYDPDNGNGGGCSDGYWWFDRSGAYPVDFSPLTHAISAEAPPQSTFASRCWALHPEQSELVSNLQRIDAKCHACGYMGHVTAKYRIEHGRAIATSIRVTDTEE